jgi:predicted GIY-YIG superfamily endonuclease/predicted DNA-binding transcriptional regulator AlpA
MTPAPIIRRRELQAHLGVSSDTMRRYLKDGKLPPPDYAPTSRFQAWRLDSLAAAGFPLSKVEPAPAESIQETIPPGTALYRHFTRENELLYVGVSLSPIARLSSHAKGSNWASSIASVTVEWLSTRAAALEAEKKAIKEERPLHNIIHRRARC